MARSKNDASDPFAVVTELPATVRRGRELDPLDIALAEKLNETAEDGTYRQIAVDALNSAGDADKAARRVRSAAHREGLGAKVRIADDDGTTVIVFGGVFKDDAEG